jgi:hypothetical protein
MPAWVSCTDPQRHLGDDLACCPDSPTSRCAAPSSSLPDSPASGARAEPISPWGARGQFLGFSGGVIAGRWCAVACCRPVGVLVVWSFVYLALRRSLALMVLCWRSADAKQCDGTAAGCADAGPIRRCRAAGHRLPHRCRPGSCGWPASTRGGATSASAGSCCGLAAGSPQAPSPGSCAPTASSQRRVGPPHPRLGGRCYASRQRASWPATPLTVDTVFLQRLCVRFFLQLQTRRGQLGVRLAGVTAHPPARGSRSKPATSWPPSTTTPRPSDS